MSYATTSTLPDFGRVPLPPPDRGPAAWLIDTNGDVPTYYGHGPRPPVYSPAGLWLRMAMGHHRMHITTALHRVERYLTGHVTPIREILRAPTGKAEDVAKLLLATAVYEDGSPFVMVTVWPSGPMRVWGAQAFPYVDTTHPDAGCNE